MPNKPPKGATNVHKYLFGRVRMEPSYHIANVRSKRETKRLQNQLNDLIAQRDKFPEGSKQWKHYDRVIDRYIRMNGL